LNWRLPNDLVTALELSEKLIVEIIAISKENQRRVLHCRMFNDAAGVEEH
jgi:hypothetical protein